jgi:hypothetical protein
MYSAQQIARKDGDVCLAVLPPTGGSQRELRCDIPSGPDERDAIESPAPASDGRLAFVLATGTVEGTNPGRDAIAVAPTLDARGASEVRAFPYTPNGGLPDGTAAALQWLGATHLVYVGQQFRLRLPCVGCALDTIRIGQGVTLLALDQPGAPPISLPGTAYATGVATGADPDQVFYTLGGDSRVYRRTLSTGAVDIAHDFGPAGVARDISLAGNQLAAVVGGRVHFVVDAEFGPVQWDSGGEVHVVNLGTGEDSVLDPGQMLFRRPAIAPGGTALVAEGYETTIIRVSEQPIDFDTLVSRASDLFLYGAP